MRLEAKEFTSVGRNGEKQIGFVAQDLQKVMPELVEEYIHYNYRYEEGSDKAILVSTEKRYSVKDNEIKYVLLNAIKDQQKELQEKDSRINELENRLEKIEKMLSKQPVKIETKNN